MPTVLETIARENFRSSGYITHPGRERATSWIFTSPPHSPFHATDAVSGALERRESALHRRHAKYSFFKNSINVFLHR